MFFFAFLIDDLMKTSFIPAFHGVKKETGVVKVQDNSGKAFVGNIVSLLQYKSLSRFQCCLKVIHRYFMRNYHSYFPDERLAGYEDIHGIFKT